MFETAELGQEVPREEYARCTPALREALLIAPDRLQDADFPVIVVFGGVDGAGKGETINLLNEWLDRRRLRDRAFDEPTQDESERPEYWRFWRHLSRAGYIAIFDRGWYGRVLVERIEGFAKEDKWRRADAEINAFEGQLVDRGTVLLKFFIHIDQDHQQVRFEQRVKIPYKRYKLTDEDQRNHDRWSDYETGVHDMMEHTSTQAAPRVLVEGNDKRFARIKILDTLCNSLEKRLA